MFDEMSKQIPKYPPSGTFTASKLKTLKIGDVNDNTSGSFRIISLCSNLRSSKGLEIGKCSFFQVKFPCIVNYHRSIFDVDEK